MFEISIATVFFAGVLSFFAPCVLPLVPFYLSYLSGKRMDDLQKNSFTAHPPVVAACCFVLGLVTIFVGLGASASFLGQMLREYFDVLRWLAALVIFTLGLHHLELLKIPGLNRQFTLNSGTSTKLSVLGSYLLGLSFAFGWTPCVGPVLASVLFLAASQETASHGTGLLFIYGLGMGLPFIAAAFFVGQFQNLLKKSKKFMPLVAQVSGTMLISFALLIASNSMSWIANWLFQNIAWFQGFG
ncbi:cytochrome c biogenesis CcdA family protein [Rhodobacteraceae bacterium nBUS_24]